MNSKQSHKATLPAVRVDKSLEQYKDKVLFKKKLEKANETLRNVGLPKVKPQHG